MMSLQGTEETVRVVAMDKDFHVDCYVCEVRRTRLCDFTHAYIYLDENEELCYHCFFSGMSSCLSSLFMVIFSLLFVLMVSQTMSLVGPNRVCGAKKLCLSLFIISLFGSTKYFRCKPCPNGLLLVHSQFSGFLLIISSASV